LHAAVESYGMNSSRPIADEKSVEHGQSLRRMTVDHVECLRSAEALHGVPTYCHMEHCSNNRLYEDECWYQGAGTMMMNGTGHHCVPFLGLDRKRFTNINTKIDQMLQAPLLHQSCFCIQKR